MVIPLHWPTLCRPPLCWLFLSIDYVKTRTSGTGGKNWLFCFPSSFPNTGDCIALLHFWSLVLLASQKFWPTPNTFTKKSLGFCASVNNEEKETSEGKTMFGPSNLCWWNILIADVSDFCWWVICVTKRNCKTKWMRLRLWHSITMVTVTPGQ